MHKQLLDNTQIYIVSSGPHIIFSAVATKRKNFEQNFALIQANTISREQMTKQNYFTNTLVLNFFKLVLYLDSNVVNNQTRYYLTL